MWVIWKAQCTLVFDNVTRDVYVMIVELWLLLIHTLRGQYKSFTCNVDVIFRKQMHFKRLWDSMLIFREDGDHIIWMYIVPVFRKQCVLTLFMDSVATDVGGIGYIHRMLICNLGGVHHKNLGDMVYKYG